MRQSYGGKDEGDFDTDQRGRRRILALASKDTASGIIGWRRRRVPAMIQVNATNSMIDIMANEILALLWNDSACKPRGRLWARS